ncbi:MAG TPA: fluoride efflux transporter CrcB [Longimicrobiales bacterium]
MVWLYIAVGGSVGAIARYGLAGWIQDRTAFGFPWGTLVVNVTGSVLIGFAVRYLDAVSVAPDVRALMTIGLLGAFTTFSTFSYETVALLEDGAWSRAALYVLGSVLLGLAAVYIGMGAANAVLHAKG